jgi:hypothetical protein
MPGAGDSLPDAFLAFQYDQLDGFNQPLQGESVDDFFRSWFALQNYSFSLVGYVPPSGSGGGASSGGGGGKKPFPPVSVSFATQIGSPWLMKLCTQFGSGVPLTVEKLKIESACICIRRAGAGGPLSTGNQAAGVILMYSLGGVTIASYKTDITCMDTIELNYEKMTVQYWRCDPRTGIILYGPTDEAKVPWQFFDWEVGASEGS